MLSILTFLMFSVPSIVLSLTNPSPSFTEIDLPSTAVGPFAVAFDSLGRGPYTGISDGRIVKYNGQSFSDYATTSPNRTKAECDGIGNNRPDLGPKCGRPLGLEFYRKTNQQFVADAYRGLVVVGPNGGLATQIASAAEGLPFKLPIGLDVYQPTGTVYFTDASSNFSLSQVQQAIDSGDATGRLLSYNPMTQQVTVLLRGLSGAGGVAVSRDGSYVLVSEFIANRIRKFWLRGPKANTSEIIVTFQGLPINIKRTPQGGKYWVAVNVRNQTGPSSAAGNVPKGIKINVNGDILRTVDLSPNYGTTNISEFQERGRNFYIGTLRDDSLGRLNI